MEIHALADSDVLAATMLAENENATFPEYRAIASVIWNRATEGDVNRIPTTEQLRDVCLTPHQFTCWQDTERMERIIQDIYSHHPAVNRVWMIVMEMMRGTFYPQTDANHYHAVSMSMPDAWAGMVKRGRVGKHEFYWDRDWRRA